jgi:hypothetical protein
LNHAPAFIFVIGYEPQAHEKFIEHDTILKDDVSIFDRRTEELIQKIAYEDGAVIIDRDGKIVSINSVIPNSLIKEVIKRNSELYRIPNDAHDPIKLGFGYGIAGTRQKSSIVASYMMPKTVIYSCSENTGHIRRMWNGFITKSTLLDESIKWKDICAYGLDALIDESEFSINR